MRGDLRHASVFAGDRFGFRVNGGYNRSDTYSRTRTRLDGTSLQREYAEATDEPVGLVREFRPLDGQTVDPATGDAVGDRDPLVNGYGAARLDYYLNNGSVLTVDGGASQVENEIFVTGIGRVQVTKAIKPYARVAMAADRYNLFAYWNSRTSLEPQFSLQSGLPIEERSDIFHVEGQTNFNFQQERGRVVVGGSVRNTRTNTSGTLMNLRQRRSERRPLLDLRAGGVQADPAGPSGGRAPLGRRRSLRAPVLAQGRPGLQPRREQLVPVLGEQGVPDA